MKRNLTWTILAAWCGTETVTYGDVCQAPRLSCKTKTQDNMRISDNHLNETQLNQSRQQGERAALLKSMLTAVVQLSEDKTNPSPLNPVKLEVISLMKEDIIH